MIDTKMHIRRTLNINGGITGNAMAKRSGGEKVSGPPGQDVPYHAAITKLAIHPWEIRARLGYGLFSGQQEHLYLFSPYHGFRGSEPTLYIL